MMVKKVVYSGIKYSYDALQSSTADFFCIYYYSLHHEWRRFNLTIPAVEKKKKMLIIICDDATNQEVIIIFDQGN